MSFLSNFDERRLLVLDLDGSLIGPDAQGLQELQSQLKRVWSSLVLVYVSGQTLREQTDLIIRHGLLEPDYLVSAVGTEIRRLPGEHPVEEWDRYVHTSFDREEIMAFVADYPTHDQLPIKAQPAEHQTPLKVSYFWEAADGGGVRGAATGAHRRRTSGQSNLFAPLLPGYYSRTGRNWRGR
jgi:sucrose-6-phosphatase